MNQFQKERSFQLLAREINYRHFQFGFGEEMKADVGLVNFVQVLGRNANAVLVDEKKSRAGRARSAQGRIAPIGLRKRKRC